VWNAGELVEQVTWTTTRLASQPGTLEVLLAQEPQNRDFRIPAGSFVTFGVNGTDYFYGRVQEIEQANDGTRTGYTLLAYDSLILLKAHESIAREDMTASQFFTSITTRFADRGLRGVVREADAVTLDRYYFINESLYSMLLETLGAAHIAQNQQFMIRDNLGTLEFRSLLALRKPLILGDESFVDTYTYGVTINNQTYNVIRVIRDDEELGTRDVWQVYDSDNIRRWGHKQLVVEADADMTDGGIREKAMLHLRALNRSRRTLKLTAIGINGLQAGDGIRAQLDNANIDHNIWIEEISHIYTPETHVCDMELLL